MPRLTPEREAVIRTRFECANPNWIETRDLWQEQYAHDVPALLGEIEALRDSIDFAKIAKNNAEKRAEQLLIENARLREENRWIPVEERLPESGNHVLLACEIRPSGKGYVCDGYYATPKTIAGGCDCECATEYDDDTDEYYLLEGWYEVIKNWEDYSPVVIYDFVTHWRPLPSPPNTKEE